MEFPDTKKYRIIRMDLGIILDLLIIDTPCYNYVTRISWQNTN